MFRALPSALTKVDWFFLVHFLGMGGHLVISNILNEDFLKTSRGLGVASGSRPRTLKHTPPS